MEREIKFRAWDKWTKKMVQPRGGDFIGWHSPTNWKECYEIMQYTGLKDKNGKEIFEKDILLCDEEIMLVTWNNEQTGFFPFTTRIGNLFERLKSGYEVVGNAFENPELLTK